jgi:hypothetical protein
MATSQYFRRRSQARVGEHPNRHNAICTAWAAPRRLTGVGPAGVLNVHVCQPSWAHKSDLVRVLPLGPDRSASVITDRALIGKCDPEWKMTLIELDHAMTF